MRFSPQQAEALQAVTRWIRDRDRPFFFLGGFAGTGKTTIAKELAAQSDGMVKFVAYTGKAASVMRSMGCYNAQTIHSLIYQPGDKSRKHLIELRAYLAEVESKLGLAGEAQQPMLEREIEQTKHNIALEQENLKRPMFTLNLESELRGAALLVVDEASMVDRQTALDLLSFDVPILCLGDPAQLPPVFGVGYFTAGEPDYMLTEVHRQALESPVLWIATEIRQGRMPIHGIYGESAIVTRVEPEEVLAADQVVVGMNATRRASNKRVRQLRGYFDRSMYPVEGERLVCLRNNHEIGLLNGALYTALDDAMESHGYVGLRIAPVEGGQPLYVSAHPEYFLGTEKSISPFMLREAEQFDFGYAMTVHKMQGSQCESVVLFDEWRGADWRNWIYTGVTRASRWVKIVRS